MGGALHAFDDEIRRSGALRLCGVDEAGRGPLAGPVVAAAVILLPDRAPAGLDDSKKLKPARRAELEAEIRSSGAYVGIGVSDVQEIDATDILSAALAAMARAIGALTPAPDLVLVDGNQSLRGVSIPHRTIVKGDSLSASIAAASIIAKEHRDRMMTAYATLHPGYGFEENAGYGTGAHLKAIARLGPSPIHRKTFRGVREHLPGAIRPGFLFPP